MYTNKSNNNLITLLYFLNYYAVNFKNAKKIRDNICFNLVFDA